MATGSWLNYFTRVSRSHFKIFIGRYRPAKPQHVRNFTSLTNKTEKSDKILKKCVFYFGICIGFGCSAGFQLFDWLSNKSFQLRCYNFIVHAKTDTSKSKQFNFVADVVEMIGPAVVHIEDKCQHDNFLDHMMPSSFGSGFLVSEDGLVLTNAHVVQNMENITVTRSDGSSMVGDITSIDRGADLACVQIRNPNKLKFETIKLGDSSAIRPGEFVVAIGSPLRLINTVTSGIVSTVHRIGGDLGGHSTTIEYIQTDAAINVGNSGGPLVNLDGEVIGINSMTVKGAIGISLAIPVNKVKEFLESATQKTSTKPTTGYIGIHMLTLTPGIMDQLLGKVPSFPRVKSGVFISTVIFGSPSHRAGIAPGDVIATINGTKVTNSKQVNDFVAKGEQLTIEILRGSKKLRVVVQPETAS